MRSRSLPLLAMAGLAVLALAGCSSGTTDGESTPVPAEVVEVAGQPVDGPSDDTGGANTAETFAMNGEDGAGDPGTVEEAPADAAPGADETTEAESRDDDTIAQIGDASVGFAQCARDNGWPDVADPATDTALPEVVLPLAITTEQIDDLMAACPPIDHSGSQPVFAAITIADSDGSADAENARVELLDYLNQAMSRAYAESTSQG